MKTEADVSRGLDGWLLLLAFGLVVTPLWILVESRDYPSHFTDDSWAVLTTPGTETHIPYYKSLMIGSACGQFARLLFSIILVILFFRKDYLFPKAFIAFRAFDFSYHLLDAWLASLVFGAYVDVTMFNAHTVQQLLLTGIPSAIWIPYMLKSKRVKMTFVQGKRGMG